MTHQTAFAALEAAFPGRIERGEAVRAQHGAGDSWHPAALPDAVFMAQSTEEVAQAVRLCADHGCPIVPFGAGSCIEGQVNATQGGLCIDLSQMNKLLRVSPEDRRSASSVHPGRANRRSSRCCCGSTTRKRAASTSTGRTSRMSRRRA